MRETGTLIRTRNLLEEAFGTDIGAALKDEAVTDIIANPDGKLWIDRLGEGRSFSSIILDPARIERVIRLVASQAGRDANAGSPIVSAELPGGGERFEGLLPPIVTSPCFSIRRPASRVITLEDYVASGAMSAFHAGVLREAVAAKQNILISGGTGSGKTTLANALLAEIAGLGERIVILEDTRELKCAAEDCVALRSQPGLVSLRDLVRSTLRLRPDRIIIGEVRGGEALDLIKAWNTGHPGGIATIHANCAASALVRLSQLAQEATDFVPPEIICDAVDLVVHMARDGTARRIAEMARMDGTDGAGFVLKPVTPDMTLVASTPPERKLT